MLCLSCCACHVELLSCCACLAVLVMSCCVCHVCVCVCVSSHVAPGRLVESRRVECRVSCLHVYVDFTLASLDRVRSPNSHRTRLYPSLSLSPHDCLRFSCVVHESFSPNHCIGPERSSLEAASQICPAAHYYHTVVCRPWTWPTTESTARPTRATARSHTSATTLAQSPAWGSPRPSRGR
jgi:hypothetical protein